MALWGGRFEGETDALFQELNNSLRFDHRLLPYDIRGSVAWANAIADVGILTVAERDQLVQALLDLEKEVGTATATIATDGDEDVHSWVERKLIERVGELGKKLHTGRSRNDQVATDLRLFVGEAAGGLLADVQGVRRALIDLAQCEQETILPGYTHMQRAQPILLAHWCLAYAEMLRRDAGRFDAARQSALGSCPLGCGALAGTSYPINREAIAQELGFAAPSANSLDAVSDRDFVLDTLHAGASCALHLSRLAEDLIIYGSSEFGFITLGDSVTSGSSLMPQKKNPDALELARGKCGRILGAYQTLAVVLKGLPLAYNKDLQEDKEPLFDAVDQLAMVLRVLPRVLDSVQVNRQRTLGAAKGGYSNATDLADYLVDKGVAFRDAHEITGRLVRCAIELGVALEELPLDELQRESDRIESDVFDRLALDALLERRQALGGTSPAQVADALDRARKTLD